MRLLVATVLAACLCAAVAVELSLGDVATQRALSSSEVVTYGPCDEPKCPAIQKPTGPPPPGYECNCADPSEHPDCGCNLKIGCCAEKEKEAQKECACKNAKIQTRARTRVIDPNYKAPPPKNEQRKFNPPTEAPNPLPPVDGDQCRPNVAKLGPGNCRRGGSSATCGDKESNCKNKDNASMGFVAAALTNEIDPTDQPESCDHQPGDADITAKESGSQGTSYATVKLKNKCTGKSRYLHKANIYIQAPKVVTGNGQALPGVSGSAAASGSSGSGSAVDPAIGSSASASQSAIASAIAQLASQSAAQSAIQSALAASQSAPQSTALPASVTPSQLESMIHNAVKSALGSQSGARPVPQSASSSASGSAAPASSSASLSGSLAKALLSSSSLSALSGSSSGSGALTPISSSSKSK